MRKALAVLTYDRAHYLSFVLPAILAQRVEGRPIQDAFDIHVFQDGLCSDGDQGSAEGHARVAEILAQLPDHVKVVRQDGNLGVALHFDFVEKRLFHEKGYDFVFFCEDDLVLAPQYAATVQRLAERFEGDERIGMLSAHPADPTRSQDQQRQNAFSYEPMGHNWAFGLFRSFWERRQPFVEQYLELIGGVPYGRRPTDTVLEWLKQCGLRPSGSSQDFVKQCATAALGAVRISTAANLGLPIGRSGLHCRPELFAEMGFDRTVVHDRPIDRVDSLDDDKFVQILRRQQDECFLDGESFPAPGEWQGLVESGGLRHLPISTQSATQQDAPAWTSSDIPHQPHMEPQGLERLRSLLKQTNCYLEYGAGGSTVLAGDMGVGTIYSVESDRSFMDAVKQAVAEVAPEAALLDHFVDIGPTAEWGNPRDRTMASTWPLYASSIWQRLRAAERDLPSPEVVLVDGRFRVACFLATLIFARPGTTILFDDYVDRPHYHLVEKYLKPHALHGRLAEFCTDTAPAPEAVLDLMAYSTEFA